MDFSAVDSKFIDVEFPADPNYTFGCAQEPAYQSIMRSAYEDSVPVIPESQWPQLVADMDAAQSGAERLVTRIYAQLNEGSCVANACAQAHEVCQAKQFGKNRVTPLSAISLYKRIGRSPNSGAMVSDGLEEMSDRGILPLDTPENRLKFGDSVMANTGFRKPYPDGWESTAKKFRGTEWYVVRTVEGLITALLHRHPVVVGRSGHSICYLRPVYRGRDLFVLYANSWGEWGIGAGSLPSGFGLDSMRLIRASSGWAFALRSVALPGL